VNSDAFRMRESMLSANESNAPQQASL